MENVYDVDITRNLRNINGINKINMISTSINGDNDNDVVYEQKRMRNDVSHTYVISIM